MSGKTGQVNDKRWVSFRFQRETAMMLKIINNAVKAAADLRGTTIDFQNMTIGQKVDFLDVYVKEHILELSKTKYRRETINATEAAALPAIAAEVAGFTLEDDNT